MTLTSKITKWEKKFLIFKIWTRFWKNKSSNSPFWIRKRGCRWLRARFPYRDPLGGCSSTNPTRFTPGRSRRRMRSKTIQNSPRSPNMRKSCPKITIIPIKDPFLSKPRKNRRTGRITSLLSPKTTSQNNSRPALTKARIRKVGNYQTLEKCFFKTREPSVWRRMSSGSWARIWNWSSKRGKKAIWCSLPKRTISSWVWKCYPGRALPMSKMSKKERWCPRSSMISTSTRFRAGTSSKDRIRSRISELSPSRRWEGRCRLLRPKWKTPSSDLRALRWIKRSSCF